MNLDILVENGFIPVSAGRRLAYRLWRPASGERCPALLQYSPYRFRDATAQRDALTHPHFARHGNASVRVDIGGSGDSDGVLRGEYLAQELEDGASVIAWLAQQAWCDGNVGMFGISWSGFNALQVAALRPPALKAIVTLCSTDDRYADDVHYMGGALLSDNFEWANAMFAFNALPPYPRVVENRWREMWLERLCANQFWLEPWLTHQRRDGFWRHGSVRESYESIDCPVLAVGGWADAYSNAVFRLVERLQVPVRAIVGPWGHAFPHFAGPGPRIGFLQEALLWWNRWLGSSTSGGEDVEPFRFYLQDWIDPGTTVLDRPGEWIALNEMPERAEDYLRLYVGADRLSRSPQPTAILPLPSEARLMRGVSTWCPSGAEDCPGDQAADDAASFTLDSDALAETVAIVGATMLTARVRADAPVANLIARLVEVGSGEAAALVTYGVMNLTHRDDHATVNALVPGEWYSIRLRMNEIAERVAAGHRLRLSLSSSYWPIVWPSPRRVQVDVEASQSFLDLPILREIAPPARPFEPAIIAEPLAGGVVVAPSFSDETVAVENGLTIRRSVHDSGSIENLKEGAALTRHFETTFSLAPDRPASALAQSEWRCEIVFAEGKRTETRTRTCLTGDEATFHIESRLEAFEDGTEVFSRFAEVRIPRDGV